MPQPPKDTKKHHLADSFFRGPAKKSVQPPREAPSPLESLFSLFPDARHEEEHFASFDEEEEEHLDLPIPSFLNFKEPSEKAIKWHEEEFIPQRPPEPTPEELRALIKAILESEFGKYFIEHLGDFSSEENRLIRALLKDKFALSLLLHELDPDRWEGFLDVIKYQPWFREKLLRNGIDIEGLLLDFPENPMQLLRALKDDFIKANTEDVNDLNAILHQLNDKERDELLFDIIGIKKLCDNIDNPTQLGQFLKILTKDEMEKFLTNVDKKWLEAVLGSTEGLAKVLELLKKEPGDSFDRQQKFLDILGGLDWVKDCLLFDRYRNIFGLSSLAKVLSKEQLQELLLKKLGLVNIPYVTIDLSTMLIVVHGVPPGLQADLALSIIRDNYVFGLIIIEHADDLFLLLEALEDPERQRKVYKDLCQSPGTEWLKTLAPTLAKLTTGMSKLELSLQQSLVKTLYSYEEIMNQANTLNQPQFQTLWRALPEDFSYSSLIEKISNAKMSDFFEDNLASSICTKVNSMEDLLTFTEILAPDLRSLLVFSPPLQEKLPSLLKAPEQGSAPKEKAKSLFGTKTESKTESSLKTLEKLLTKPEEKKRLNEVISQSLALKFKGKK